MRKPNQGMKSSSSASARSSEKIDSYGNACGMPSLKYRTALVKVNKHPMDGAYMGFSTPNTIEK